MNSVGNEIFDVVDDRDQVIGREIRSEVHRLGLKHRAVHILLTNCRGETFLQKRSMTKDTWPGAWDSSASGHLEAGEGYDEAAIREVREELGLELSEPLSPILKLDACEQTGQEFVWIYRGEAEGPFTLHPDEIDDGRWFTMADVDRLLESASDPVADSFCCLWELIRERGLIS